MNSTLDMPKICLNPKLNLKLPQVINNVTSLYNIHASSTKQAKRILKLIKQKLISLSNTKFFKLTYKDNNTLLLYMPVRRKGQERENIQGNGCQLEGRVNNQIVTVKGLLCNTPNRGDLINRSKFLKVVLFNLTFSIIISSINVFRTKMYQAITSCFMQRKKLMDKVFHFHLGIQS